MAPQIRVAAGPQFALQLLAVFVATECAAVGHGGGWFSVGLRGAGPPSDLPLQGSASVAEETDKGQNSQPVLPALAAPEGLNQARRQATQEEALHETADVEDAFQLIHARMSSAQRDEATLRRRLQSEVQDADLARHRAAAERKMRLKERRAARGVLNRTVQKLRLNITRLRREEARLSAQLQNATRVSANRGQALRRLRDQLAESNANFVAAERSWQASEGKEKEEVQRDERELAADRSTMQLLKANAADLGKKLASQTAKDVAQIESLSKQLESETAARAGADDEVKRLKRTDGEHIHVLKDEVKRQRHNAAEAAGEVELLRDGLETSRRLVRNLTVQAGKWTKERVKLQQGVHGDAVVISKLRDQVAELTSEEKKMQQSMAEEDKRHAAADMDVAKLRAQSQDDNSLRVDLQAAKKEQNRLRTVLAGTRDELGAENVDLRKRLAAETAVATSAGQMWRRLNASATAAEQNLTVSTGAWAAERGRLLHESVDNASESSTLAAQVKDLQAQLAISGNQLQKEDADLRNTRRLLAAANAVKDQVSQSLPQLVQHARDAEQALDREKVRRVAAETHAKQQMQVVDQKYAEAARRELGEIQPAPSASKPSSVKSVAPAEARRQKPASVWPANGQDETDDDVFEDTESGDEGESFLAVSSRGVTVDPKVGAHGVRDPFHLANRQWMAKKITALRRISAAPSGRQR